MEEKIVSSGFSGLWSILFWWRTEFISYDHLLKRLYALSSTVIVQIYFSACSNTTILLV